MGGDLLISGVVQATPDKLRSSYSVMKYHKEDPLAGGSLMIRQVAKRLANIRFDSVLKWTSGIASVRCPFLQYAIRFGRK